MAIFSDQIRSLSLAAPAYNESAGIEKTLIRWVEYLRGLTSVEKFEIVICNDGSKDHTAEILADLSRRFPEIRPVYHGVNQGAAAGPDDGYCRHTV